MAARAAIAVHLAFALLFAGLGLRVMVLVNIGSVLVYVLAMLLLHRRLNRFAVALVWFEIVIHAVVATRLLDLDSGFQYYLLVMLPLIFISPQRATWIKILLGTVLMAIYVALDLAMHRLDPVYVAPRIVLDAIRVFNLAVTFVLLALLAHAYHQAVQSVDARLRTLASTDPLTGALNRRSLLDLADRLLARSTSFSMVLADVDHFKTVNDSYGHECGDRVLVEMHQALYDAVRPEDAVARWGGEEFILLLPQTSLVEAGVVAERARRTIAALEISIGNNQPAKLRTTMTFGVASLAAGESPEACVARADAALYRGKAAGRNQVTTATA